MTMLRWVVLTAVIVFALAGTVMLALGVVEFVRALRHGVGLMSALQRAFARAALLLVPPIADPGYPLFDRDPTDVASGDGGGCGMDSAD